MSLAPISFHPRWREELVASSSQGKLVFELTMGTMHVYFPDESRWLATSPGWAREQWRRYHDACEQWSQANRIPFTVTSDAHLYEER